MRLLWRLGAEAIQRRFLWVLAACAVITVAMAPGITRLEFRTSQDTLISPSSQVYKDNEVYQRQFGGEPVLVLFSGNDIRDLLSPRNIAEMDALEAELNASGLFHAVISPLGVLRFFHAEIPVAAQLAGAVVTREQAAAAEAARAEAAAAGAAAAEQQRAAAEASAAAAEAYAARVAADAQRLAGAGEQFFDNPAFVDFLLLDERGGLRPEFEGIFIDEQHALMIVRLNGNMSIDEQGEAAAKAAEIVRRHDFDGFETLPTGPAILLKEINDQMRGSMARMALMAVGIMVVVLFLVFRARWRLLSLGVILTGSVWAFGLIGYLGIPLTIVTISGLPILIGIGVDFAIQVHSRFEEETERAGDAATGLREAFVNLGPPLLIAVLAAVAGFLALYISDVPMIRDFGTLLALGILVVFVADVALPASTIFWRDRGRPPKRGGTPLAFVDVERFVRSLSSFADRRLVPLLAIGVAFIAIGFWADGRLRIETNPEEWVPQDSPVLHDLLTIRDVAGSSSELGILVRAPDVTDDEVLAWMSDFEARQLQRHPEDLVRSASVASITSSIVRSTPPVRSDVDAVLPEMPASLENAFISPDRTRAHILFAIRDISLDERRDLVEALTADLDPPPGVSVTPSGLAVIGIETVDGLTSTRGTLTYAALAAVLVWLLVCFRSLTKTVLPLLPILIALGSSSAVIYWLGIELTPLTALSGPLIVATCTEFSVLLMARYLEERERGLAPREAVTEGATRIGRAFIASGLTTIAGFGVLAFSGFPLLVSFGVVTAVSVGIALVTTLAILPPLLVWADREARRAPAPEVRTAG